MSVPLSSLIVTSPTLPPLPSLITLNELAPGYTVACGYCSVLIVEGQKCGACKVRSYCGPACQAADWVVHYSYCIHSNFNSEADDVNTAIDQLYQDLFTPHCVSSIGIRDLGGNFSAATKEAWIARSQKFFLHVRLGAVANPPSGRHNRAAFLSAELSPINSLPAPRVADLKNRLAARAPAICLGFSYITDPLSPNVYVTTITHAFNWPNSPGSCIPMSSEEFSRRVRQRQTAFSDTARVLDSAAIA